MTGRSQGALPGASAQDRLPKLQDSVSPDIEIRVIAYDPTSGSLDIRELETTCSRTTAAVFLENPSYLGFLEGQAPEIAALAHEHGAEWVVAVDPITLGVLAPPVTSGADIG